MLCAIQKGSLLALTSSSTAKGATHAATVRQMAMSTALKEPVHRGTCTKGAHVSAAQVNRIWNPAVAQASLTITLTTRSECPTLSSGSNARPQYNQGSALCLAKPLLLRWLSGQHSFSQLSGLRRLGPRLNKMPTTI